MRPALSEAASHVHDLIVVGGGVTGACIARDAALRGLSVVLLEKHDFSHATSAASSKLIHGGLRYLKNLEVGLIRESLRERRVWLRIAPHLVYPLPVLLPSYRSDKDRLMVLRAGLTIYDLLAFDRGWLADPDQRVPGHRKLGPAATLALQHDLPSGGLAGSLLYYDCQMFSPERLALECLLSASAAGARLYNYCRVDGLLRDDNKVVGVRARDLQSGEEAELRGRVVVNAAGPWADLLLAELEGGSAQKLLRSKGIHVITRPLTTGHALAIAGKGGHFFVLPWRGRSLIGTTDAAYHGAPDEFRVTEADIAGLLATVNAHLPAARLTREDVQHFYGGLRPLVDDGGSTYDASRRSEVCDHAALGGPQGLISAIGGKWTTSRHLAEQVLTLAGEKLGRPLAACTTATTPLPGGAIGNFRAHVAAVQRRYPRQDPALLEHLVRNYGARAPELLVYLEADPQLARPLAEGLPELGAQVIHAVRAERAVHLEDVVFRRTGLGTLGPPGEGALIGAARLMGRELGWDRAERMRQVERVLDHYVTAAA